MVLTKQKGGDIVGWMQNKFNPPEMHLPGGYQYCGPFTKLKERLARGDPGINRVDKACKRHDISYSKTDNTSERHLADNDLVRDIDSITDPTMGERVSRAVIKPIIRTKVRFGLGIASNINRTMYCLKCKDKTESNDVKEIINKKGRPMLSGICSVCGTKKFQFLKIKKN